MNEAGAQGGWTELHRHLDGAVRWETLEALAREQGVRVPSPRRLRLRPGMGLDAALESFRPILSVLQRPEDVRRVAAEACEDAAAEGIEHLELRFAPQLHRGAGPADIVDAALEGVAGRAGLVLCGLYGEPPGVLAELVAIARDRPGVVGIDLAGGPQPSHRWILEDAARAFRMAAEAGLGRTVHAGEGRPPEEIALAVEVLGAQRIGHGTTLLDDPEVAALVVDRGVTVEACLSSNVHTGAIARLEEHPLREWLARGVRVALCTDNPVLSGTTLANEHAAALRLLGGDEEALGRTLRCAREAAFARGEAPRVAKEDETTAPPPR
ncbi:MAG: hypothetical protein D6731_08045 [Planctomycetota bacterium]|nr:MAG: hypothetical protein D6731_08045 [Planctomycetota bacterium]